MHNSLTNDTIIRIAIFFHGINQLWSSIVYKIWNVPSATPCFKFVKPSSSFDAEKTIVLPEDMKLTNLEKSDIEKVCRSIVLCEFSAG